MSDRFYPTSARRLREVLLVTNPLLVAERQDPDRCITTTMLSRHLLWMLNELQTFPGKAGKRGRWLGYVQGRVEAMGLISNAFNRDCARADVEAKLE